MPGEPGPVRGRQHPGGEQRLGHPLGLAAVPPGSLAALDPALQMGLDLARGARAEFGHCGHHVVDESGVALHDVHSPTTAGVFAHPPAQQWPVLNGHQRRLMRPVLHQQPRRSGTVTPRRSVEDIAAVGAQAAEDRRVMRAHRHRHRVQLEHLDPADQPAQVRPCHRARWAGFVETLSRRRDPAGLRGSQPGHGRR